MGRGGEECKETSHVLHTSSSAIDGRSVRNIYQLYPPIRTWKSPDEQHEHAVNVTTT